MRKDHTMYQMLIVAVLAGGCLLPAGTALAQDPDLPTRYRALQKNYKALDRNEKILQKAVDDLKDKTQRMSNESDAMRAELKEAAKRGLTNVTDVPEALTAYLSDKSKKLFFDLGIFSEAELEGRAEVMFEQYTMKIQIEARVLGDLAINHIVPTAVKYQNRLMENVLGLKEIYGDEFKSLAGNRIELIKEISDHVTAIKNGVNEMVEARKVANKMDNEKEKSKTYSTTVAPFLDKIRYHIDKLELIVDDEIWPLPKYRELLFSS